MVRGASESCAPAFGDEEGVAESLGELFGEVPELGVRGGERGEHLPRLLMELFRESELHSLDAVGDPGERPVAGAVLDEVAALAEGTGPRE